MRFLVATGGDIGCAYGVLTSPGHKGVPSAIVAGAPWAADNNAFAGGFKSATFYPWLKSMTPYIGSCLFVVVPDAVADAEETHRLWAINAPKMARWPLAFVAQDGQESRPLPTSPEWRCLFIGGSTEWKESAAAVGVIKQAQELGKHIHIGRVNWRARYRRFAILAGSQNFTCDGTRQRFEGRAKTLKAWKEYENQKPLIQL